MAKIYKIRKILIPKKCQECKQWIEKGNKCSYIVKSFKGYAYKAFYHEGCI